MIQEHINDFRSRTRSNQYDVEAHYGLGVAYYSLGLVNDSVDELARAAQLTPENPHIQAQLAIVSRESFRAGNAAAEQQLEQHLQTALLLDPEHLEANTLKMQMFLDKGQLEQAVRQYDSMPASVQDHTRASLAASLERQGQHFLQMNRWKGAEWYWESLQPLDSAAAQRLRLQFLRMHELLVPTIFKRHARESLQDVPTRSKRIVSISLAAIVGLLVGSLQLCVVAVIVPTGENNTTSGGGTAVILLSFLLFLAAPVIAVVWRRRRGRVPVHLPNTSAEFEPGSKTIARTKYNRQEILAGLVDMETLHQVVDVVMGKLRTQTESQ